MKVLVILVALAAYVSAGTVPENARFNPVYDYIARVAIPQAERIQKAEEAYFSSRIAGGRPAAPAQIPYQVGLISDIVGTNARGICGGSLINARLVISAAHCWFDGRNHAWRYTAVLGSVHLFTGGTRLLTSDVTTHPNWIPWLIRNDIMLVRFRTNVIFSPAIGAIQLPSGRLLTENFSGFQATTSGFGLTHSEGTIEPDQFLSYVRVNVISNGVCNVAFPTIIQDGHICTSTLGNIGPLQGDSGGPLVAESGGRLVLIGSTSFGSALSLNFPTVYTRITSYMDFIEENL